MAIYSWFSHSKWIFHSYVSLQEGKLASGYVKIAKMAIEIVDLPIKHI